MKLKVIRRMPLVIALLFLFNPNVAVIDPLPDFIGYLLLCFAFTRLADLNEIVSEALNLFKKMVFIDLGKWIAIVWIFGLSMKTEQTTALLLWSFIFAVLELIFLIPAYTKLFGGITQIGYLYPNTSVFNSGYKTSKTDKIKTLTTAFLIVKTVMYTLPEFAALTNSSYDESFAGSINLYRYIGIMRLLAFVTAFVVGIVWLVVTETYFNSVVKDKQLTDAMAEKYRAEVLPKTGIFVKRDFKTFVLIASVGVILTADLRFEYINVTPDVLSAVAFIFAFIFIGKCVTLKLSRWLVSTSLYTALAIASTVLEYKFFNTYYYGAIIRNPDAKALYIWLVVINILKSLAFIYMLTEMYFALTSLIEKHTGYVVGMERRGATETKMVGELWNELKGELIWSGAAAILYVASDICFDLLASKLEYMGAINIALAIIFIYLAIKPLLSIESAMETKYMLE